MSLPLDTLSTSMFLRGLNVLAGLIDRAAESGLDEATLMEARLAPDMRPFPDQVRMAAFSASVRVSIGLAANADSERRRARIRCFMEFRG